MYLFVGYLYFLWITNPTISETTLYKSSQLTNNAPAIEGMWLYLQLAGLFVLSSFIIGVWLAVSVRTVKVQRLWLVLVFTVATPVFFLIPGMFLPVAREILLFLPPAMMVYAASILVHPENPCRKWLARLGLFTIVPMFAGEFFLVMLKPLGAATMYLLMLAVGLSAMSLIVLAREEHLKRLRDEGESIYPLGLIQRIPDPASREALADKMPPPVVRKGPRPAYIILAAGAVLFLAFLPPLWVLDTDPGLELSWQLRSGDSAYESRSSSPDITVQAYVVNRGARAALGLVELVVHNDTRSFPIGTIDRIDGFGSWYVKATIQIPNTQRARHNITISLSFNGRLLETRLMKIPGLDPVFALVAVIIIKAFRDSRKGRRRD